MCYLPCIAHNKHIVVCISIFAVWLWHTANVGNPVVDVIIAYEDMASSFIGESYSIKLHMIMG